MRNRMRNSRKTLKPLSALLVRRHADLRVAARPLAEYAHAASVTGTGMKENM